MTIPYRSAPLIVEDGWIDYNGHLNMAYYNVLFDRALDEFVEVLGVGPTYVTERNATLFTAEVHLCYLRELKAGDPVVVDTAILGLDRKRLHFFQTLIHAGEGYVSATSEQVAIHVDFGTRRSAVFPPDRFAHIATVAAEHAKLRRPEATGRSVAMRKRAE